MGGCILQAREPCDGEVSAGGGSSAALASHALKEVVVTCPLLARRLTCVPPTSTACVGVGGRRGRGQLRSSLHSLHAAAPIPLAALAGHGEHLGMSLEAVTLPPGLAVFSKQMPKACPV